jgi:gas vesicle protein
MEDAMLNGVFNNSPVKLFLMGAILGGGTALLLAPQSGLRTRRMIRRKAEDTAVLLKDAGHGVAVTYSNFRKGVGQALRRGRQAIAA